MLIRLALRFLVELMNVREVIPICEAIKIMYQVCTTELRMMN